MPPLSDLARRLARALPLVLLAAACTDSPTDAPLEPRSAAQSAAASAAIELWWPSDGGWHSGTQPFKGLLKGYSLGQYTMHWQVDGGALNPMADSYTSWPHKEALVSLASWSWRGTGPYLVTFVARDRNGATLATRSVSILVGKEPANPIAGARFWVDPASHARLQADAWRATRPADAEALDRLARRSQADWFGDWSGDVARAVGERAALIAATGALPVFVAYNLPIRDCNLYSRGGAKTPAEYRAWIRAFAQGIGARRAVVVLEPDGLASQDCLPAADQQVRMELLRDAVQVLKALGRVAVYLDAGNARWQPVEVMSARLRAAGIDRADGFALNVSNFHTTADNAAFGQALSFAVGGKHFVIDTSRNGLGPAEPYEWCNAAGRALGTPPTTLTGYTRVDAFLWLKRPGESDGECQGGPSAGAWWAEYALGLAQRMPLTLAALP